ncbi:MAG: macro domain-containing protein [Dethiobacter sp.]|nr:macro domain-containing protein [Dethiobacter sp.]MCL5982592.1 macro domain-containing protein [Bacillota bacterium]
MNTVIHGVTLECVKGDIVAQADIAAVVNAANAELRPGGGVDGAIHRAAGPGLAKESRPLAPIAPGEAVITGGHSLPNSHVIHCLGPVYGTDKPEDMLLANCYSNALTLAEQHGLDSVAFPAISTGVFGYPVREAAEVAFKTIIAALPKLRHVKKIRFCLHSDEALRIHSETLSRLVS